MKLEWDQVGKRTYEAGCDHGVFYTPDETGAYVKGVAWNGLVSVSENPTGGEPSGQYADNIKYLNIMSTEDFEGAIEAFTYPPEFAECDGTVEVAPGVYIGQQDRKSFGFSYRTRIGNDVDGQDYGYKLHLIYNAMVSPSEKTYETINDSPDVDPFSWDVTTTPVQVDGHKPTSTMVFDSTTIDPEKLKALEDILYGTEDAEPRLPLPNEIIAMFKTTDGSEVASFMSARARARVTE